MRKRKNGFFTFIFSLIPGAGEMYMGFMKQGVSLMTVFWGALFLYNTLFYAFEIILVVMPIVWAYSFFHVHNLRSMPDEQFYAQEDNYLFSLDNIIPKDGKMISQYRKGFSIVLIFLGIALLWQSLSNMIRLVVPDVMMKYYNSFVNTLPRIVISLFMVWCGVWLIKGKKEELYGGGISEESQPHNSESENSNMNIIETKEGENE